MNQMNMAGMNPGNPGMAGVPMMNNNNMVNGAMPKQNGLPEGDDYESKLNSWIYGYLIGKREWETARQLKNSGLSFSPPLENGEDEINGINEDSKNGIMDNNKRPADLPSGKQVQDVQGGSLLLSWFSLFWDVYAAQRGMPEASRGANHLMAQNKMRRDNPMYRTANGMMPNQMDPNFQNMIRMNPDLRQKALQNQNGFRGVNPQMMAMQRSAMMQNQNMRRDPSGMDMNGQRPRSPGSGDHAPSPKRARMDNTGFNPQQMMPNGRPPQGMPPQMMAQDPSVRANALLENHGINPANLSESQFASFQQQNPAVQAKSIQVYAQNLAKTQREGMSKAGGMSDGGSPMMADGMMPNPGQEYFGPNGPMMMNRMPNGAGNGALQDYQMQLMLLEQQNKKRLMMARQEQEAPGQPGMPAAFAPGMSPQGSRGGPSPGPNGERRGTPKLGQPGMDGSPLPDGSMRGSPGVVNMINPMQQPDLYAQMNMRPPPSSNPAYNGQFAPQQAEAMRLHQQQRGMPNGNWPQGPQGQAPIGQQPPPQQQPTQIGTPQQRNDMPPPPGPPPGATNGRAGSDDTPPTPQTTNKANPKGKKEGKPKKTVKKNSTSVAPTPASETDNPPATPTPSTPITPSHPNSFNAKTEAPAAGAVQPNNPAPPQQVTAPQPDMIATPHFDASGGLDQANFDPGVGDFGFGPSDNLLDSFDFNEFLDPAGFTFDGAPPLDDGTGMMVDAGMGEAT